MKKLLLSLSPLLLFFTLIFVSMATEVNAAPMQPQIERNMDSIQIGQDSLIFANDSEEYDVLCEYYWENGLDTDITLPGFFLMVYLFPELDDEALLKEYKSYKEYYDGMLYAMVEKNIR